MTPRHRWVIPLAVGIFVACDRALPHDKIGMLGRISVYLLLRAALDFAYFGKAVFSSPRKDGPELR